MLPPIERYRGREQSFIKHLFLNKYLEAAAYKLLQSRQATPAFNFVDAFAGPWRVSDGDGFSDASFSQAIDTLETVRNVLRKQGHGDLQVRYRFCERNRDAVTRLRRFAAKRKEFDIRVFEGSFESNLKEIRESCRHGFTFTFIDPTGWNIESWKVFSFLKDLNGEYLLNFMSQEINRHASWSGVAESFGRFLADPTWEKEFHNFPDILINEEKILCLLKKKMKEAGIATYLPEMNIRRPYSNRTKMKLVLGTHSVRGVEVFRDVQEKVEKESLQARDDVAVEESGQPFLFSSGQLAEFEAQRDGVGCLAHIECAREHLCRVVEQRPGIRFRELSGIVMEEIPVRITHLNTIAMKLRRTGQLGFDLPPRKRTPTPTTAIRPNRS